MGPRNLTILCLLLALASFATGMKFILLGDWGDDNEDQYRVAHAMSAWCDPSVGGPCDFITSAGDNFYPDGVISNSSYRFNTTWRWVYDLPHIENLVWDISLGNHDYYVGDRELYQVEFSKTEPLWYLPWIYYDFYKFGDDDAIVHFIVVDTPSLVIRKYDPDAQIAWVREVLERSTADWKIILTHYAPYSTGKYGPGSPVSRDALVPLCNEFDVHLLVAGHDHNLQHISSPNVTDYVVSAGGGRGLYEYRALGEEKLNEWGLTVDYFGYHFGFVAFDITKTSFTADFVNDFGNVTYSFTRTK